MALPPRPCRGAHHLATEPLAELIGVLSEARLHAGAMSDGIDRFQNPSTVSSQHQNREALLCGQFVLVPSSALPFPE